MIINKLNQIRTRFRQERQAIDPLDRVIGVSYDSNTQPIAVGSEYNILIRSKHTDYANLTKQESIRLKFNNEHVANNFLELVDSDFTYHDFGLKRPEIQTRFVYNYEFADYENYSRNGN